MTRVQIPAVALDGITTPLTRIVLAWSLFTALSGTATGFLSLLTWRFLFGVG